MIFIFFWFLNNISCFYIFLNLIWLNLPLQRFFTLYIFHWLCHYLTNFILENVWSYLLWLSYVFELFIRLFLLSDLHIEFLLNGVKDAGVESVCFSHVYAHLIYLISQLLLNVIWILVTHIDLWVLELIQLLEIKFKTVFLYYFMFVLFFKLYITNLWIGLLILFQTDKLVNVNVFVNLIFLLACWKRLVILIIL